jgi:nitrogen fixation protein NifU and related proteins
MAVPEPQFDDLYREVILDHFRRPRNRGTLPDATATAEGMNPVCGDEVRIDLKIEGGTVKAIAFDGQGCSISQSSASMMTEQVEGATTDDARGMASAFRAMMVDGAPPVDSLSDIAALEGVAKFPARVKCALLPWTVLEQGLEQAGARA